MSPTPPMPIGEARVLATINFHYNEPRVEHFSEVVRALAEMRVGQLDLVVVTQTTNPSERETIGRICRYFLPARQVTVLCFPDLEDPRWLVWCHKEAVLRNRFLGGDEGHTHFLCLEDDIRFTQRNMEYFLDSRELLRQTGLLPGFFRVEFDTARNVYVAVDHFNTSYLEEYRRLDCGGYSFLTSAYPYCAMYLLDRDMADEHVASASFNRDASESRIWWSILERANLGLCYENVPSGFQNRHAIPVHQDSLNPVAECWVTHLGNKYARPGSPLAQLPVADTFWWSRAGKFPTGAD